MYLLTLLSSTTLFKNIFLTAFTGHLLLFFNQIQEQGFYDAIISNTPVQVFSVLGIIAGVIWILKMASNAWSAHMTNMNKVKMEQEKLEQEEIETDIKQKRLDDDTNN